MAAIVVKGYRPSKKADIPPPFYVTATDSPPSYCHTCGRVVSSRRVKASAKYCSDKCKHHKPPTTLESIDRLIEDVLYQLLELKAISAVTEYASTHSVSRTRDDPDPTIKDTRAPSAKKGDKRVLVPCSLVETIVFGRQANVSRGQGRRRERARALAVAGAGGPELVGDVEYDEGALLATLHKLGGSAISRGTQGRAAPGDESSLESDEDDEDHDGPDGGGDDTPAVAAQAGVELHQHGFEDKRIEGQRKAQQREQVRNACRRAVVFGISPPGVDTTVTVTTASEDEHGRVEEGKGARKGKKDQPYPRSKRKPAGDGASLAAGIDGGGGRRLCEAIMRGDVVEPSFAKGEWGVRWRE